VIENHTAIAVQRGCGGCHINNIVAEIADADRILKS
jgi:cytochrome c551/c552